MSKPLPKTRRKEALRDIALGYAERLKREQELTPIGVVMNAYEDGYRAAMSDLRRVIAEQDEALPHPLQRVNQFLKPLK